MRDTEKLQQDVVAEIAWNPVVDSSELSVTASGVTDVKNEIEVRVKAFQT